ncbi:MAG TPA: M20 family metallopeptidase [Firmicutes bacterium]|nr:M20 family metallopeptidase [Bacillota bacterium]
MKKAAGPGPARAPSTGERAREKVNERVRSRVQALAPRLREVARFLKEHPELGHEVGGSSLASHPLEIVAIGDPPPPGHTREFAEATLTEVALQAMVDACAALALTGADLLYDPELVTEVRQAGGFRLSDSSARATTGRVP